MNTGTEQNLNVYSHIVSNYSPLAPGSLDFLTEDLPTRKKQKEPLRSKDRNSYSPEAKPQGSKFGKSMTSHNFLKKNKPVNNPNPKVWHTDSNSLNVIDFRELLDSGRPASPCKTDSSDKIVCFNPYYYPDDFDDSSQEISDDNRENLASLEPYTGTFIVSQKLLEQYESISFNTREQSRLQRRLEGNPLIKKIPNSYLNLIGDSSLSATNVVKYRATGSLFSGHCFHSHSIGVSPPMSRGTLDYYDVRIAEL